MTAKRLFMFPVVFAILFFAISGYSYVKSDFSQKSNEKGSFPKYTHVPKPAAPAVIVANDKEAEILFSALDTNNEIEVNL